VYNPVGRTTLHHADASCELLTVKMERHALENELCERLGRPIRTPVSFQGHLHVMAGLGRDWVKLVKSLVDILDDTECNLLNDSLVARHLEESIIAGFLVAARHNHSDELATPASPCRPRHVKRAIDLIEQRPDEPWTVNELARVVGVRARTLQEGFQQHVGTPPMMYLRIVRLDRAHEELETSDVVDTTVAQIAYKWGFSHL
jgi:AraC-like DNA-binding protein